MAFLEAAVTDKFFALMRDLCLSSTVLSFVNAVFPSTTADTVRLIVFPFSVSPTLAINPLPILPEIEEPALLKPAPKAFQRFPTKVPIAFTERAKKPPSAPPPAPAPPSAPAPPPAFPPSPPAAFASEVLMENATPISNVPILLKSAALTCTF